MVTAERDFAGRLESACWEYIVCDGFWRGEEDGACLRGDILANVCIYSFEGIQD